MAQSLLKKLESGQVLIAVNLQEYFAQESKGVSDPKLQPLIDTVTNHSGKLHETREYQSLMMAATTKPEETSLGASLRQKLAIAALNGFTWVTTRNNAAGLLVCVERDKKDQMIAALNQRELKSIVSEVTPV